MNNNNNNNNCDGDKTTMFRLSDDENAVKRNYVYRLF